MKNLYLAGLISFCLFGSVALHAQEPFPVKQQPPDKPLQFSSLPSKTECAATDLEKFFSLSSGQPLSFKTQDGSSFSGVASNPVKQSAFVVSINIRLENYPGALFTLSRIREPDGSYSYAGRILSPDKGDVLVLTRENNRYYLQKQIQKYFMTE